MSNLSLIHSSLPTPLFAAGLAVKFFLLDLELSKALLKSQAIEGITRQLRESVEQTDKVNSYCTNLTKWHVRDITYQTRN